MESIERKLRGDIFYTASVILYMPDLRRVIPDIKLYKKA